MASDAKKLKRGVKALRRYQDKQAKAVRQIGKQRARLEKAARKLRSIEAKMARQEQQVSGLRGRDEVSAHWSGEVLRPARLIINPNSGSFAKQIGTPEDLVAMLRIHGIEARVHLKTSTKEVRRWVRKAVHKKESLVIAVGGDGTIEDVALELVGSRTTLGIIPAGTMNNLARGLGIPLDIEQACALLGAGISRQIDVGCIRSTEESGHTYFMESAGLGMAIAMPAGQNIKKGRWGRLPESFRKIFDVNAEPTQIELDNGETLETKIKLVTVSNSPLWGLNNLIAPDAKMDDGLFDLAVYDGMNDVDLAGYFLSTANGQRVTNPNVHFYRTRRAHLTAQKELVGASDKDEIAGSQELDFKIMPRALTVIVGQGSALNWPVDAVHSSPPLTGAQEPSKSDAAAEKARQDGGEPVGTLNNAALLVIQPEKSNGGGG